MNGGTVKGFAMTPEELPFLQDIFESVEPLPKYQDDVHSAIYLEGSCILIQYHWSILCLREILGP